MQPAAIRRDSRHDDAQEGSDVSALVARLTSEVNEIACGKTKAIQTITGQMKIWR